MVHGHEDDASRTRQARPQPRHPRTSAPAAPRSPFGDVRQGRRRAPRRPPGAERETAVLRPRRAARRLPPRGALRADGVPRGRAPGDPALHHPHALRGRLPQPAAVRAGGRPRPGAEDVPVPRRAGRGRSRPAPYRRPRGGRGRAADSQATARGTAEAVAGRRSPLPVGRRPLRTAPGADHAARRVGPQRPDRADHGRAVVRPGAVARGVRRRGRTAVSGRLRARVGQGHADVVRADPDAAGLRAAAARPRRLPGREGRGAVRPPGRAPARRGHARPAALPARVRQSAALARRPQPRGGRRPQEPDLARQPGVLHAARGRLPRRDLAVGGGEGHGEPDDPGLREAHPRAARHGGRGGESMLSTLSTATAHDIRFGDVLG